MAQAPQKPCDICQQSSGDYICFVCEQLFCTLCKTFHKRQKSTKNHEFLPASEPISEVKSKCKDHKETFNLFCTTCDVPVCTKCITGKHQGHKISDIQETVQRIKQTLDKELNSKVEDFENSAKHIIKEIDRVENEASSVIQSVKEEANRLKVIIDRHADQSISSLKADVARETSRLQKVLDDINTTMASARRQDDQWKSFDKKIPNEQLIGELLSLQYSMEKLTINPLSNGALVKYIAPTKTFQVEDVMGKCQISEPRRDPQDTTKCGASNPSSEKHGSINRRTQLNYCKRHQMSADVGSS